MADFKTKKKIYYHDTDCGGVVYYANYLKFLEEARTEWLRDRGICLKELSSKGTWFVVANVNIEYKSPAHYQDDLTILTRMDKITAARMDFLQEIKRDDSLIARARTTLVCVGKDFKPSPIPQEVKKHL